MNDNDLLKHREKINDIDLEILKLLDHRAGLALEIGSVKREKGIPTCDREREREVIAAMVRKNKTPLPEKSLRHIFGEIISACRALQEPTRISFLGPEATFSHIAAREHFGGSADFLPKETISDVFREVESGRAHFGVVPVENSTEGGVGSTLDRFMGSNLKVCGEVFLRVSHALMSKEDKLADVSLVMSHPQALGQCLEWLAKNLPNGKMVASSSTSAAAVRAASEPGSAAVGSEMLAEIHNLNVLSNDIQDRSLNLTRFLVIAADDCPPTGRDKTSVWFAVPHEPGSLYACLQPLADLKINMTRIESRPAADQGPWEYVFFLDLEGHRTDEVAREALKRLDIASDKMRILGSYPMADPSGREAMEGAPWNQSL